MEAIILAGGFGTRLRSMVPSVPKPMAPIEGRPFLEYLLDYWLAQGVTRVILSVGYKADLIQAHFGSRYRNVPLEYAVESEPRGTGGGFLLAMDLVAQSGPCLVLNGDTYFEMDLPRLLQVHRDRAASVTVALLEVLRNSRYQVVELRGDFTIAAFKARQVQGQACYVNGGVYLFERSALAGLSWPAVWRVSLEDEVFPALIKARRRVVGHVTTGRFIDIGVPEDYTKAGQLLGFSSRVAPKAQGV